MAGRKRINGPPSCNTTTTVNPKGNHMSDTQCIAFIESPTGDYSKAPRHEFWSSVPKFSGKPDLNTLRKAQKDADWRLEHYRPTEQSRILTWQLGRNGALGAFVTGLLDMQEGKITRAEFDAWERAIRPQLKGDPQQSWLGLTVTADLHFSWGSDKGFVRSTYGSDPYNEAAQELADEFIDDECGSIQRYESCDAEWHGERLSGLALIEHNIQVEVPWRYTESLSEEQIAYLKEEAREQVLGCVSCDDMAHIQIQETWELVLIAAE